LVYRGFPADIPYPHVELRPRPSLAVSPRWRATSLAQRTWFSVVCKRKATIQGCEGHRRLADSALAEMEQIRDRIPAPALATTGGELLGRIRRVLGRQDHTTRPWEALQQRHWCCRSQTQPQSFRYMPRRRRHSRRSR
jgi:hypothetical protein